LRKEGSKYFIGHSDVIMDANSDLYIKHKSSYTTRLVRPGITRSLASFVFKPFVTFLKKALKNEVETVLGVSE
jgi:hypothetical protein